MLTREERMMLRSKIREVEEAVEDVRACLDPMSTMTMSEIKRRATTARNAIAELRRYAEEDLS